VCRDDCIVAVERLRAGDLVTVVATEAALPELEVLFGPPASVGELTLDPSASIGDLFEYYGATLPADADPATKLTEFVSRRLHRRAATGDVLEVSGLTLTVRQSGHGTVRRVGLRLSPGAR
jgi:NhaP-type Na+/H+ and K+/H+ antiporter